MPNDFDAPIDDDYVEILYEDGTVEYVFKRKFERRLKRRQYCMDCYKHWGGWYMIHDHLWQKICPGEVGHLCINCCQRRLGRNLTEADFTDAPINVRIIENIDKIKKWK